MDIADDLNAVELFEENDEDDCFLNVPKKEVEIFFEHSDKKPIKIKKTNINELLGLSK